MLPYFKMHSTPRLTSSRSSVTTVCIVRDGLCASSMLELKEFWTLLWIWWFISLVPLWHRMAGWCPCPFHLAQAHHAIISKTSPFSQDVTHPLSLLWWQDMRSNGQLPQQRMKWPSDSSRKMTNRKSLVPANILEGLWFLPPCMKTFTVWVTLFSRSLGLWLWFVVLLTDNKA